MAMETESIPLTIIAGLEASIPNVSSRNSLEIHVIGAASRELSTTLMSENILHHFPLLKRLQVHCVGPEASDEPDDPVNHACKTCKEQDSYRAWDSHRVKYDQFLQENPAKRPDLIVGFNTGWSTIDTPPWTETLDKIMELKVPTVFTAYTLREAMSERAGLSVRAPRFIDDVQENKWKGVIQTVSKSIQHAYGIFELYSSNYWYVFQGRRCENAHWQGWTIRLYHY